MDHVMDNRKTFMDVHQALDWVNALSEAESDDGVIVYHTIIIYHCTLKISAF